MTNITMLCRGRYRLTAQALESLYLNTKREDFSLVLIHDSADDDFRVFRLLQGYAAHPNCSLLRVENSRHVLAQLKNLGVFWSRQTFGQGDWLYLSDCDVAFLPGWLEQLTQAAEFSEHAFFRLWGGQVHPYHQSTGTWAVDDKHEPCLTQHGMLDGPSWLMRWSTWRESKGLKGTTAGVCKGEDVQFCQDLVARGGRIGVIHPHVVVHTGLTQTDGQDAPGRDQREKMIPEGILAE